MKIIDIAIENFLVLTKAEIHLADRGLTLIQGINEADSSADSNGSGKSSIADALSWAIYGVTARGETGDAIINNTAGKNTVVQVRVFDEVAMQTYRIVRYRKHKTGKNSLQVFVDDGLTGEKDITKGTDKLTQDVVDKIIGASHEVFAGAIYVGQERMPDLPSMTDKMLKVLIEEAAGINALEDAYTLAKSNALKARAELASVQDEIQKIEVALASNQSSIESTLDAEKSWKDKNEHMIRDIAENIRNVMMPEAERLRLEAPQSEIDRVKAEIVVVDARIASVTGEQKQLEALQSDLTSKLRAVASASAALQIAENNQTAIEDELKTIGHKVGCACGECGRIITTNEIRAASEAVTTKLTASTEVLSDRVKDLATAQNLAQASQSAVDAFKVSMTDLSKEASQRSSLSLQLASLLSTNDRREKLLDRIKSDLATIKKLQAEESPFTSQIVMLRKMADDLNAQVQKQKGLLAIKQKTFDLETEVVRVFSPAGVRARILDEVTPYLNAQTSQYLSVLSDGNISAEWSTLTVNKSGEVKEKFAIDVQSSISSKTFKGLSGGEKRKVRVATALALQDLVATRASKPIDLMIADEIDDALDSSGLERLMMVLEDKAKERGTVMVISHNELKDSIRNVLTVRRTSTGETEISEIDE